MKCTKYASIFDYHHAHYGERVVRAAFVGSLLGWNGVPQLGRNPCTSEPSFANLFDFDGFLDRRQTLAMHEHNL